MAAKKQVVDKETNQISEVEVEHKLLNGGADVELVIQKDPVVEVAKREPGTIIKTYIQNGLRYNRVVQDDGVSTLDIRG